MCPALAQYGSAVPTQNNQRHRVLPLATRDKERRLHLPPALGMMLGLGYRGTKMRITPHIYNEDRDIGRLLDLIEHLTS